jgi:hypothetical protein
LGLYRGEGGVAYGLAANCEVYEGLDHKIDTLRMFCQDVENIKSSLFHVNMDPCHRPIRENEDRMEWIDKYYLEVDTARKGKRK